MASRRRSFHAAHDISWPRGNGAFALVSSPSFAWTNENFGAKQAAIYRDTLVRAIGELTNGPDVAGSKARNDILPGLRVLHVARHGRRGRHFLLYRLVEGRIIEIGRILHDQMDLQRHLQFPTGESG